MSELNKVAARFTYHSKVAHASTVVGGSLHECSVPLSARSKHCDFVAPVALKPKVIERLADVPARNDNDKLWIFTRSGLGTKPNSSSAFQASVSHYRKAAGICKEVDRSFEIAYRNCEVRPAH